VILGYMWRTAFVFPRDLTQHPSLLQATTGLDGHYAPIRFGGILVPDLY